MATVYPSEFLEKYQVLEEQYHDGIERNKRARALRKEGWEVTCDKVSFQDLARDEVYTLSATRKRD